MLQRLGTVTSTQEVAAELPIGSIVVADHQTAGRGRLGRAWAGRPGSGLYATFVLEATPLVLFAAGVAGARACGPAVRLKWPNDLILDDKKLGGILAEVRQGRALVGIGVNLGWAPSGASRLNLARDPLLDRLIAEMAVWTAAQPEAILSEWRGLSWTLGQLVRVEVGGQVIEGIAEDIAPDGALLVAGRRVVAGEVTRLRPAG